MVEVVEYRPSWPSRFEALRAELSGALDAAGAAYRGIEHVGSTAVPGLAAKPVIDVDVVVDADGVEAATVALTTLGLVPRGDLGVAGRYAFDPPARLAPSHVYVAVDGCLALRNHLAVRDVLRSDAALRDEYGEVKRRAAAAASDIDEYILLKSEVLERVLRRGGLTDDERAAIDATNRAITSRGAGG